MVRAMLSLFAAPAATRGMEAPTERRSFFPPSAARLSADETRFCPSRMTPGEDSASKKSELSNQQKANAQHTICQ